jgi:hypothetical protein
MPKPKPKDSKATKEKTKITDFFIPCDVEDVNQLLKNASLTRKSIHNLDNDYLGSGSDVTQKQSASFTAFFPRKKEAIKLSDYIYTSSLGLENFWDDAEAIYPRLPIFRKVPGGSLTRYLHKQSFRQQPSLASLTCDSERPSGTDYSGEWRFLQKPATVSQALKTD